MRAKHAEIISGYREARKLLCWITAALLFLVSTTEALELAGFSLGYSPAKPLSVKTPVAAGVSSFGFCTSVGGVAFGAVARPLDGSQITGLDYLPTAPDGQRLALQVRQDQETRRLVVNEYDWVLLPTALVADSDQDALVTYFGALVDEKEEKRLSEQEADIVNYHPALLDTFLGLRVMHGDLLAFHAAGPLNFTEGGVGLKAPGETLRDEAQNYQAMEKIGQVYEAGDVQSYVVCDVKEGVGFRVAANGRGIEFVGRLYWLCWKMTRDMNDIDAELDKMDEDESFARSVLVAAARRLGRTGTLSDFELQQLFDGSRHADLVQQVADEMRDKYISEHYFKQLPEVSDRLSRLMEQEQGGNPPVYQALTKTMHYTALFRYVKKTCPKEFAAFVNTIRYRNTEPRVRTPTVLIEEPDQRQRTFLVR